MKSEPFDPIENITQSQALILKACLAHSKEARQKAVREWEETVVMEDLDFSSSRLVPYFLHGNQQSGITTIHDNRLKVIYKHWWLRSQHIAHQLKMVHEAFTEAGIRSIVTKGASLKTFYERAELRPMADFDLIVRPADFEAAFELVKSLGYVQSKNPVPFIQKYPKLFYDFDHALFCAHPKNNCELDLHWRVGSTCSREFTNDLWLHLQDYGPTAGAKKPQLAYEVFMLMIHAAGSQSRDNLNWVLDIALINKTAGKPFWEEARRLAVTEKKEDLFDYSCAVLKKFGVEAPNPGTVKRPRLLVSTTVEDRAHMSRFSLLRNRVWNISYRVNRLFPHAGLLTRLYQMGRCLGYYFSVRRTTGL